MTTIATNKNRSEANVTQDYERFQSRLTSLIIGIIRTRHRGRQDWGKRLLYPLSIGGKGVRSLLLYTIGLDCQLAAIEELCCCFEFIYTYFLVHDDLSSRDNDCFKKAYPTMHKMFSEAEATLVGDALFSADAFSLLSHSTTILPAPKIVLIQALSQAAGSQEMLYGQWLDINNLKTNITGLIPVHHKKTEALFGFVFSAPDLLIQASVRAERLKNIGIKLGLAFQIQDDLLDFSTSSFLGKTAGKNHKLRRRPFFTLFGEKENQKLLNKHFLEIKKRLM